MENTQTSSNGPLTAAMKKQTIHIRPVVVFPGQTSDSLSESDEAIDYNINLDLMYTSLYYNFFPYAKYVIK